MINIVFFSALTQTEALEWNNFFQRDFAVMYFTMIMLEFDTKRKQDNTRKEQYLFIHY